ncbi:MAG: hypothetical protein N2489_04815 [Clostridia bacterium]|nr:hypothetical protein [Clostridia bacterium]
MYNGSINETIADKQESSSSEPEFIEVLTAVERIVELVSNGLFSDAARSIKSNREKLCSLPQILKSFCTAQGCPPGNSIKPESIQLDCGKPLALEHTVAETVSLKEFAHLIHNESVEEYAPISLDKLTVCPMETIYFKEYSYPQYFDTFLKHLFDTLSGRFKAALLILEREQNTIGMRRYTEGFATEEGQINEYFKENGFLKLAVLKPNAGLIEAVCMLGLEMLVVYDKTGSDVDLLSGSGLRKLYLARSASDLKFFNLPAKRCIVRNLPNCALSLEALDIYKEISNEDIKRKLYRKHFIEPFLSNLKNMEEDLL